MNGADRADAVAAGRDFEVVAGADDELLRPDHRMVATLHAIALGTLSCPADPWIPCLPPFVTHAGRWAPRPRRLAGDVISHDDKPETLVTLLTAAYDRVKLQTPSEIGGSLYWCAIRWLDACRQGTRCRPVSPFWQDNRSN